MAKNKQSVPDGQLGDWLEEVPDDLQASADAVANAREKFNKANKDKDTAEENLKQSFRDNPESTRVRVETKQGPKVYRRRDVLTVATEALKKQEDED